MTLPAANTTTSTTSIDAMLRLNKWASGNLSYNFPTQLSYYPAQYLDGIALPNGFTGNVISNFAEATAALKTLIPSLMTTQFSAVANLTFTQVTATAAQNFDGGPQNGADLSIAMADLTGGGRAFQPGGGRRSGDVWFDSPSGRFDAMLKGDNDYRVVIHELGHALGLRHPHEVTPGSDLTATVMPSTDDSMEFTLMTYRMFEGATDVGDTTYPSDVETYGFAQSLMMHDIRALQQMYGANFNHNATATTYTFSPTTGEMSINGVGQGAPGANRIFLTIWDGGGVDTYNFSNYTTGVNVDLAPGGWSTLSAAQLAKLDISENKFARGNVFNALQFNGDARSLIENANGGSGNDTLKGNAANNTLNGGLGNDDMSGLTGNDIYYVDSLGDIVRETAGSANGTQDTVISTVTFRLDTTTTAQGVEHVALTGSANATVVGSSTFNVINGNSGNNYLAGYGGNDTVNGFAGNDTIFGGDGKDTLTGGLGNDLFFYSFIADSGGTQPRRDVITDFSQVALTNDDWIDLAATDANGALAGNQAFTWLGTGAFTGAAGELRYFQDVANNRTIIEGQVRVTADSPGPELSIELTGLYTLTAGATNAFDIIL